MMEKLSKEVQTDYDYFTMSKMVKNYESVAYFKKLVLC